MSMIELFIIALFLPLFPFSMIFNLLYSKIRVSLLRFVLLLIWPQVGIYLLQKISATIPEWITTWAILTSILYAWRVLSIREMGLWTAFIATSSWSLLWILQNTGSDVSEMNMLAFGISLPLAMMALLTGGLEKRYGAAYLGLYGGLAETIPRFSGILVIVVLAVIATPLFPTFFAMLSMVIKTMPIMPYIAAGIGLVWLLWSWAGAKLIQGLVVGQKQPGIRDMNLIILWMFVAVLVVLIAGSVHWLGAML